MEERETNNRTFKIIIGILILALLILGFWTFRQRSELTSLIKEKDIETRKRTS